MRKSKILFIILAILLIYPMIVLAVPRDLNIQIGKLFQNSQIIENSVVEINFSLWTEVTGGSPIFTIEKNISINNGTGDVIIQPNEEIFINNSKIFLSVTIATDNESLPRINITSAPYAIRANLSDSVRDNSITNKSILSSDDFSFNKVFVNNDLTIIGSLFGTTANLTYVNISQDLLIIGKINGSNANFTGTLQSGALTVDTNTLYVDSVNNRVGIGTTSPATLLQLAAASPELRLNSTNGGYIGLKTNVNNNTDFDIQQNGTSRLFINPAGNIGIGTASPGIAAASGRTILNIESAANTPVLELSSRQSDADDATMGILQVTDPESLATDKRLFLWEIKTDGTTANNRGGRIDFYTKPDGASASLRLTIRQSGNVGIGTTSPNDALEVVGNVRVSGSLNATNINASRFYARNGTAAAPAYTFIEDTDTGIMNNGIAGNNISIVTGGSKRMTIDSSGNVGIGTANPGVMLHLGDETIPSGVVSNNILAVTSSDSVGRFFLSGPSSDIILQDSNAAADDKMWQVRNADQKLTFRTLTDGGGIETADILVLDKAGNIGIGTTSPGSLLHLSSATAEIRLNDTDNPNWWQVGAVGDDFKIYLNDTSADGITIDQDGNVGIGTTTPNDALEVSGNVRSSGSAFASNFTIVGQNGSLYQPVYGTDDELVLYLPFNTPNGSVQYDRSPFGNDGRQINGTTCNATLGKYGAGCEFDGYSFINISNPNGLNFADRTAFTAEAWIKSQDAEGNNYVLGSGSNGLNTNGNVIRFWTDDQLIEGTSNVLDNKWHHVAVTRESSNNVTVYVDGVSEKLQSLSGVFGGTTAFYIGAKFANQPWNGTIDEVRIYKRALSPEEIRTHYLRGSGFGASGAITADKFRVVNTTGGRKLELNDSAFAVHTGGAERLKIDSSGNVGIGTTSPNDALEVVGNVRVSGSLNATNINASRFYARNGTAAAPAYTFIEDTNTGLKLGSADNISIVTGGSDRLTVDSVGNVGIGTGRPAARLHIIDVGGTDQLAIENTAAGGRQYDIRSTRNADAMGGGRFAIDDAVASATRFVIDASGNVGIGNTAPNFLVDVAGKINSTSIITNEVSGSITTCNVGEIRGNATANKICLCTTTDNWKCATVS